MLLTSSAFAEDKNQKISPHFLKSEPHDAKKPKLQVEKTQLAVVYLEDVEKIKVLEDYASIEAISGNLVQVRSTNRKLREISDLPFVSYVRRPKLPHKDVVSEGVARVGAQTFQNLGVRGSNVSIAVLDAGFQNYLSRIGTELPDNPITRSFRADNDISAGEEHGTAAAEIVYDVAPGSKMYLVNYETELEFKEAVNWLIGQRVNIISHSAGWTAGPFDGTGFIADIVNSALNNGTVWINSAGNYANRHWDGGFVDRDGNGWHEFNGGDEYQDINAAAGELIEITLSWDDDWLRAGQDYELYLIDRNGNIVAASEDPQSGRRGQEPVEVIEYIANYTGVYKTGIKKFIATRNVFFELYSSTHELEYKIASSSLAIPSDVSGVIAVGATRWNDDGLEPFSSQGPTNDNRTKPDITAPDGVSTATYGFHSFFGTSASAPLAAGAAALLMSVTDLSAGETKELLESSALDLGVSGKDNLFGSGRVNVSNASKQVSASTFIMTNGTISLPDVQRLRNTTVTVQLKNMLGRNVREATTVFFNVSGGTLAVSTGTTSAANGQLNVTLSGNTSSGAVLPTVTVFISGMTEQSLTVNMPQPALSMAANVSTVTVNASTPVQFMVTTDSTKVVGATVTLSGAATGSGTTDINGNAAITVNATSAGTITAIASKTGYAGGNTMLTAQAAGAGTLTTINVAPGAAAVISGQILVFTASGFDRNGNAVSITPVWNVSNASMGMVNESTGVFTALSEGTTLVNATADNLTGSASVTVVTQFINGTITGAVTNATSGASIAGARVTANSVTTTTNANGNYSISILPGVYIITANATEYNSSSVSVTVGSGATLIMNFTLFPEIIISEVRAYDANGNGRIDRSEAVQAVMDYFAGIITRQEAIEVVMAYFSG